MFNNADVKMRIHPEGLLANLVTVQVGHILRKVSVFCRIEIAAGVHATSKHYATNHSG